MFNKKIFAWLVFFMACLVMAGATYTTKVYKDKGGDRIVIDSTGVLDIENGGNLVFIGDTMAMGKTALTIIDATDSCINIYVRGLDSSDIAFASVNQRAGTAASILKVVPITDSIKVYFNSAIGTDDSAAVSYQAWKD